MVRIDIDSPYPLQAGHLDGFREQGFVKLGGVLSEEAIGHYGPEITRLTKQLNTQALPLAQRSTYDRAFLQVMNLWERSAMVREFVMGQRLAQIAAQLLGVQGVRLYHDQSLFKEPGGGITPAHADQYYWPLASERTVTAWIPLQAVPLEMGPLGFYARSQSEHFGRNLQIGDMSEKVIVEHMSRHGFEYCVGAFDLGEVSFHQGWLFHKAGANLSQQPRSVMTIIYMDAQMRLLETLSPAQANDRDQWCPDVEAGQLIATPLNPVLWPR